MKTHENGKITKEYKAHCDKVADEFVLARESKIRTQYDSLIKKNIKNPCELMAMWMFDYDKHHITLDTLTDAVKRLLKVEE